MIRNITRTLLIGAFLFSTALLSAQDPTEVLIWNTTIQSDSLTFDTDTIDAASYNAGLTPVNPGQWGGVSAGYIQPGNYIEVSFSPNEDLYIDLTSLDFIANTSTFVPIFRAYRYQIAYSYSASFSDSTIVYDYPLADLSGGANDVLLEFDAPVRVIDNQTIYFRIYPYDGQSTFGPLGQFYLNDQDVIFNGIVYPESATLPVTDLEYTIGCAAEGSLTWNLPAGFDSSEDTILVFAKKTDLLDVGSPTNIADDYDDADTSLAVLDGAVPAGIQYENDADAMLVYKGVGTSVDLGGFEDGSNYFFYVFNTEWDGGNPNYSSPEIASGESPSELSDVSNAGIIVKPNEMDIYWTLPSCVDSVIVVVKESSSQVTGTPSGYASSYATGVNSDYSASTSFFNGTDDSDGKVVYVNSGSSVNVTGLNNGQIYNITIWVNNGTIWSEGVFLSGYPNDYEIIITQVHSEFYDFVEFLTLTEIDFAAEDVNVSNYASCESGKLLTVGDTLGASFFSGLGVVPAGTYIRFSTENTLTEDLDASDGMIQYDAGIPLSSVGGDQVMIYKGDTKGADGVNCGNGGAINEFLAGFNYGNSGWIEVGSGLPISSNESYAPPSVSNLEMPATNTPNYSLKDTESISGDAENIHSEVSDVLGNWTTGIGISPQIKLKDVQFDQSDYSTGTVLLTENAGDLDIDFSGLTFTDATDIRYIVVIADGFTPSNPVDRYTCYTPDLDYNLADTVVFSVASQIANQDPCGVPTNGLGRIVYFGNDNSPITVTGLPCGATMFVQVFAVKGNGFTANVGTGASASVTLPTVPVNYYSAESGNASTMNWSLATDGSNPFTLPSPLLYCADLVIQNGDVVNFDTQFVLGGLTIEAGGKATFVDNMDLFITRDLVANDSLNVTTDTRITMRGFENANNISGDGPFQFYELEAFNSYTTDQYLYIDTNISITEGLIVTDGNVEIETGDTLTLRSTAADNAAYIGEIPAGFTVEGDIKAERFLPSISTNAPGGSGNGVGWRYTTSPVEGATFADYMNFFTCTGFTNSDFPDYPHNVDPSYYYFPNLQKYDETQLGSQGFGFDGDANGAAPNILNRRDASETISAGEGIFSYIGPVPETMYFTGRANQGDIVVNLSVTDGGVNNTEDGWHLVANPYPCAIDVGQIVNADLNGSVYIYNADNEQYVVRNINSIAQLVASGQAFWMKANVATSVTFTESMKEENAGVNYYKDGLEENVEEGLIINLVRSDNDGFNDQTAIKLDPSATFGFDEPTDAYKLYSLHYQVPGLSTVIDGFSRDVAINTIPTIDEGAEFPIKLNCRLAANYELSFDYLGSAFDLACLTLTDHVADTSFVVDASTVYTFYSELRAEDAEARFTLSVSAPVSIEASDATCYEAANGSAVALGVGDGPFVYNWYNANDELIATETTSSSSMMDSLAYGFYSVEIEGNATDCPVVESEIFIAQPEELVNLLTSTDPDCNLSNGRIELDLDPNATWDIFWMNQESNAGGEAFAQNGSFTILAGAGNWDVITVSECGPIEYSVMLDDQNDVVADFILENDTVHLMDGEVMVNFNNASENAIEYQWNYGDNEDFDPLFNGQYTYTEAGVYAVTLLALNADGCYDYITKELVVMGSPDGIEDLNDVIIRSYIAYNNNSAEYVIELKENKQVQINLVNSLGQTMIQKDVFVSGQTRIALPMEQLSSGMYLVITTADGTLIDNQKLFVR